MNRRILYIQYTNPAGYPPLEHSSRILADGGWSVLFLGTGAYGADALQFLAHPSVLIRRWKFRRRGLQQKLHYLAFNLWVTATAILWRPKWVYASDLLASPAAFMLKKLGFRVLYHEHDSPNPEVPPSPGYGVASRGRRLEVIKKTSAFQKLLLWTRTQLARRADLCVLPNEERIEIFRKETGRYGQTLCVWNCSSRNEAEIEPEKRDATFTIFYHGSIVPSRLPVTVVEALAALPTNVRLEIAGYETVGHMGFPSQLLERAKQVGVSDRVKYLGSVPSRAELLSECRRAHVGLAFMPLMSRDSNEQTMAGASNKPFDYMASGLALLVSDLQDWKKMFVEPGFGRACNPSDPESIATAVRLFINDETETKNMGERGRQRILDKWNYEVEFAKVVSVVQSV